MTADDTLARIIYRVEHAASGVGPYNVEDVDDDRLWDMVCAHSDPCHPAPQSDGRFPHLELAVCHRFGFDTRHDLALWFHGWLDTLDELGFVLAVYRAPSEAVLVGDVQVAFDIERAERVGTEALVAAP